MSITKRQAKWLAGGLLAVAFAVGSITTGLVRADGGIVFLTRLAGVMTTYPRNVAFSVGTTTAQTQVATTTIGKLNVTLNPADPFLGTQRDGFQKAFQISST